MAVCVRLQECIYQLGSTTGWNAADDGSKFIEFVDLQDLAACGCRSRRLLIARTAMTFLGNEMGIVPPKNAPALGLAVS